MKELTGQILIDLSEPRAIVSGRAASVYRAETTGAIEAYLDRLIDREDRSALLAQLSLADSPPDEGAR